MPRLKKEEREQIEKLSHKELTQIVVKAASMEKSVYDYIMINFLDKSSGEQELFEQTKENISRLFVKRYKGYSEQLQAKNMLSACIKSVNEFSRASKNKVLEAELLIYILDEAFSYPHDFFGTCFTAFDTKTAQILKRLITIVTKKIHEDYFIEYKDKINEYLKLLHRRSDHLDYIYRLPQSIEL